MEVGNQDGRFHWVFAGRFFERVKVHAAGRVGGQFQSQHVQVLDQLQKPRVGGRFHQDCVAGAGHGLKAEADGLDAAAGDHDVVDAGFLEQVDASAGQLPSERLVAGGIFVKGHQVGELFVGHGFDDAVELFVGQQFRRNHRTAQLKNTPVAHGFNDGGGNNINGDLFGHRPVAFEGRWRQNLGEPGFDVKSGFSAGFENPAFLQFDKGLVNRGNAQAGLPVQLAHRRYLFAGPVYTVIDFALQGGCQLQISEFPRLLL